MSRLVDSLAALLAVVAWFAGMVLAKGFWSTLLVVCFFPWGWYLVVERCLIAWAWV